MNRRDFLRGAARGSALFLLAPLADLELAGNQADATTVEYGRWTPILEHDYGLGHTCTPWTLEMVKKWDTVRQRPVAENEKQLGRLENLSDTLNRQGWVISRALVPLRTENGKYQIIQADPRWPVVGRMWFQHRRGFELGYTSPQELLVVDRQPLHVSVSATRVGADLVKYEVIYAWRVIRDLFCGNAYRAVAYTSINLEVPSEVPAKTVLGKCQEVSQKPYAVIPQAPCEYIHTEMAPGQYWSRGGSVEEDSWNVATYFVYPRQEINVSSSSSSSASASASAAAAAVGGGPVQVGGTPPPGGTPTTPGQLGTTSHTGGEGSTPNHSYDYDTQAQGNSQPGGPNSIGGVPMLPPNSGPVMDGSNLPPLPSH